MALLEFYGDTCPHCIAMKPLVADLEKALGVTVEQYEVWNNADNAKKMDELDKGECGGVPYFYNTETNKHLCGSTDYESLKAWAQGS
ncbi:hypothetical protein HYS28_01040 [Candidatus Uhrbacteria bacterium]|nr:hypothetical protein [Candidatus Uhrbacteria bacterium]